MENRVRNYFVDANTARGWIDFYDSNFSPLETAICLYGWPSMMISELIADICHTAKEEETSIELIHDSLDNHMAGIILPKFSAGVINEPIFAGYSVQRLLGGEELDCAFAALQQAKEDFASALKVHDGWEKIYLERIDFQKLDQVFTFTADRLIQDTLPKTGKAVHRFFGAATADGSLDYIPNLTEDLGRRIFLKGRPGTGKSTLLKRFAHKAMESGYDCEVYHCGFDPDSLDMVIVRELSLCIFDSTAPHEYQPSRPGDEVLDLYKAAVVPHTDETCAAELAASAAAYHTQINKAVSALSQAKEFLNEHSKKILEDVRMEHFCTLRDEITEKIFS